MNRSVKIAIITATGVILAAIAGAILQPGWWRSESSSSGPKAEWTIAGTVVDQVTNRGVGQASVTIVGRAETCVTEDNGNFRIKLQGDTPKSGVVRIHVAKRDYIPFDGTTTPTETFVIQLRKEM